MEDLSPVSGLSPVSAVSLVPAVAGALARRPGLWGTAARALVLTAAPGWWRRPPFAPLPSGDWLAFRLECATGRRDGQLAPQDVVAWLEWCKAGPGRSR